MTVTWQLSCSLTFRFGAQHGCETAFDFVSGIILGATPLFEPDPLERVPGPTVAGNRPKTATTKQVPFLFQAQVPLSHRVPALLDYRQVFDVSFLSRGSRPPSLRMAYRPRHGLDLASPGP